MLEIQKYARKPFLVDVVEVTPENLEEAAKWCMGDVVVSPETNERHIKVRVHRPLTERQTKAFAGDLILYAGTGFKVYPRKAFEKSFEPAAAVTTIFNPGAVEVNKPIFEVEVSAEEDPNLSVAEQQARFAQQMSKNG